MSESIMSQYRVRYQLRPHRRDQLIEFIRELLLGPFVLQLETDDDSARVASFESIWRSVEGLIDEHRSRATAGHSRLSSLVPSIGSFFTELKLVRAFQDYNRHFRMTRRRFIPPSFNDIRHIMNRAQVYAIADRLRMVTLDGDQTLYEDGGDFQLKPLADSLVALLEAGIHVALVTAAGYPKQPKRYEQRLDGLMQRFQSADPECLKRFFVLGGECNYLFSVDASGPAPCLKEEPDFAPEALASTSAESIRKLLDVAHETLLERKDALELDVQVLRKDRAVGIIPGPGVQLPREQLDEIVLSVQHNCAPIGVPFCAFNGGRDVWVDVGNKSLGVAALQKYLHCPQQATLHIGDQFLGTGNDISTRQTCCTVWVASPKETAEILTLVLEELEALCSRA